MRVINETGDIKCITERGDIKWFSPHIVDGTNVLRDNNIKVFEAPEELKPFIVTAEQQANDGELTKAALIEKLKEAKIEFNPQDKKEVLYNLYINQKK